MKNTWFAILNPISGKGKSLQNLEIIKSQFTNNKLRVKIVVTKYPHHEKEITIKAINAGFTKIIAIGGDGTLHHIVNGVMSQNTINTNKITLAVIPFGTGNDWIKTYNIPNNFKSAIAIIAAGKTKFQDIGKITIIGSKYKHYFNNGAGIGFDGYVVYRLKKNKKTGPLIYLLTGLTSFLSYKYPSITVIHDNNTNKIVTKIFMFSIGICKYSGGGLRLTDYVNHELGQFDITLIRKVSLLKVILNIRKLFNGNLRYLEEVEFYKTSKLKINIINDQITYIQADGEKITTSNIHINLINNAINFIINENNLTFL